MAKVETIVTYVLLLLVLSGFAFSILPLTQAQGLTCQARIDRIEAPSRVDLGANLLVKSHLVISCTPSQLTVVARVDLTDQITGKLYSSDSISLGYIGSAPKTYNETAENSATAASSAGTWKLKISVSIYAAGTVIASASQPFEVQVGTAVTTQTTAKPTTSTTSAPRTTTTTSLTTTASGLGDNTPLIIGGVVVAVAVVASLLVFSKRKKGPAGPAAAAPPKAKAVMEPPKIKPAAPVQPAEPIISTGYAELDTMLAGGLPLGYAILVVSPPCDEKDLLFRRIIESSLSTGRPIFFLSRDLGRTQDLAARYKNDFYAFHPQADKIPGDHPNIIKISGVENLSDMNISLTKSVDMLIRQFPSKVIILDMLSDVLLQHKALTTRRWLDDFVSKRKAEGFTVLGTLNPLITSKTESQSIIDLFDGIIEIYERELRERARRFLVVKKMYGRKYQETELMLDKDKLF